MPTKLSSKKFWEFISSISFMVCKLCDFLLFSKLVGQSRNSLFLQKCNFLPNCKTHFTENVCNLTTTIFAKILALIGLVASTQNFA
jgi:hypothetical protein